MTWFVTMLPGPMVVSTGWKVTPMPTLFSGERAVEQDADAVARDDRAAREAALDDDSAAGAVVADHVVGDDRAGAPSSTWMPWSLFCA